MSTAPRVPQAFGPYDLIERVSVGGTGEVFRALHRTQRWMVALKRLMPAAAADPEALEALQGEADLMRAVDHPGVSKVLDVGTIDGLYYLAYEFVHGRDLRAIVARS